MAIKDSRVNFFYRYYRLISALISLILFFSIYNKFIVNRTLEYMKYSFEQIGLAYDLEDLEGLDIVITDAMMEELGPRALDSVSVTNMEYARSIITRGKNYKQVKDAKRALGAAVKEMEKKRGKPLVVLDTVNRYVKRGMIYLARLPRNMGKPAGKEAPEVRADEDLFKSARALELEAKLEDAFGLYEEFIGAYPAHEKTTVARLRAAYVAQRLGRHGEAWTRYKELVKDYPLRREADIARIQLSKLAEIKKIKQDIDTILIQMSESPESSKEARQELYYQIGTLQARLFNLDEAKKFFRRSYDADPSGSISVKSRFNAAWVDKENYNIDLSTKEFLALIEETSGGEFTDDARYQVANIYQQEGRYEEAIDMLLKLADDYENEPLAALYLFQAGASYLYDLNDQEKADEIFNRLKEKYPDSKYVEFASRDTSTGMFLTFIVPRATRVVAWRGAGLMCLSGYAGEMVKFKARAVEEDFNKAIRDWLKVELPDTVGNVYVDIKDTEFIFKKDKALASGHITMGKFEVDGETEGYLKMTKAGSIRLVITKAILEKIPLPPVLINMALSGLFLIVENYFPVTVTDISMVDGAVFMEGFGGRRIVERIKKSAKNLMAVDFATEDIGDLEEKKELYGLYKEKFPWGSFSVTAEEPEPEDLFYDFFTRMSLYASFKLLETIKDSKLDYQRSIRTLGKLDVIKEKFKVDYTDESINTALNMFILKEFPWLIEGKYLFDVKGLDVFFKDGGQMQFESYVSLGQNIELIKDAYDLRVKGTAEFEIDRASGIPYLVYKELTLNRRPFPVEKLNELSAACLDILKDGHIPFKLHKISVGEGGITLKGEAADDFLSRVFSDPYLFVIFHIRDWDLYVAGVQRIRPVDYSLGDRWLKNLPDNEVKRISRERPGAEWKETEGVD